MGILKIKKAQTQDKETSTEAVINKIPKETAEVFEFSYLGTVAEINQVLGLRFLILPLTLGLYFPWVLFSLKRYFLARTKISGSKLRFEGELMDSFLNLGLRFGFVISWIGATIVSGAIDPIVQIFVLIMGGVAGLFLAPLSVYSSLVSNVSNCFLGGRRFVIIGGTRSFVLQSATGIALSLITFGIYLPIMLDQLLKFVVARLTLGEFRFMYTGQSRQLLKIHLIHMCLFPITAGISLFWYAAWMARYLSNNLWIGGQNLGALRGFCQLKGGEVLGLFVLNVFGLALSLGIATPWILHFNYQFVMRRIKFYGNISTSKLLSV
jgi:uncharacterized membrane protein YjgN (DUF898 family)